MYLLKCELRSMLVSFDFSLISRGGYCPCTVGSFNNFWDQLFGWAQQHILLKVKRWQAGPEARLGWCWPPELPSALIGWFALIMFTVHVCRRAAALWGDIVYQKTKESECSFVNLSLMGAGEIVRHLLRCDSSLGGKSQDFYCSCCSFTLWK